MAKMDIYISSEMLSNNEMNKLKTEYIAIKELPLRTLVLGSGTTVMI